MHFQSFNRISVSTNALKHHLLQQYQKVEEEDSHVIWHLCTYLMHDQLSNCSQVKAEVYKGEDYAK